MKNLLKEISEGHIVAGIYTEEPGSFLEGYVECADEDTFVLAHITNVGLYDGYILKFVKSVFKITTGDQYGRKIEALYKLRGQSHMPISFGTGQNVFENFIEFARSNRFIVSVEMHDDDENTEVGFIKDFNKKYIRLLNMDSYGHEDGESTILIEDITAIACDTDTEHALLLIAQNRRTDFPFLL